MEWMFIGKTIVAQVKSGCQDVAGDWEAEVNFRACMQVIISQRAIQERHIQDCRMAGLNFPHLKKNEWWGGEPYSGIYKGYFFKTSLIWTWTRWHKTYGIGMWRQHSGKSKSHFPLNWLGLLPHDFFHQALLRKVRSSSTNYHRWSN